MKPYFYQGHFTPPWRSHALSNAAKFQSTMRVSIEAFGGKLVRCHMLAGSVDPIGFIDFPDDLSARAWNAFYASQQGVESSTIARLLDDDDLVAVGSMVKKTAAKAAAHRTR